ncbi:carboxypeptidase B1-like isoform X2 [Macrobrachium rosenbergii]|uniref:carboxypeptidase B1-like isoform X2 n=1 Tax=Macrobrachium rosenbergii TaxID=79674 RepID=UPI0034D42CB0
MGRDSQPARAEWRGTEQSIASSTLPPQLLKMGPPGRAYPVALLLMPAMLFLGGSEGAFVDYEGWKILGVHLENVSGNAYPPTLSKLEDMDAEGYLVVLSASKAKGIAEVAASPKALEDLTKMQDDGLITFEVISNNLGKELDLEERAQGKDFPRNSITFSSYMTFSQMSSYLETLQAKHPSKVRVDEVGKSFENRPIYRVRITNNIGNNIKKKVVFIDGGIHAREWVSPPAAFYAIEKLIANTKLTKSIEWQIIPMLNPDGYVYTWNQNRLWRKNRSPSSVCVGVDLNRNFGYQWGGLGTSSYPCSDLYRGPSAFSEPESRALRDAMLPLDGRVKAYITFHSYGQYILYPWGYSTDVTHPLTASMNKAGRVMAKRIQRKTQATYNVGNSAEAFCKRCLAGCEVHGEPGPKEDSLKDSANESSCDEAEGQAPLISNSNYKMKSH